MSEAVATPAPEAPTEKRGPGRPKGSGGRSGRPTEKRTFRIYKAEDNGNLTYVGESKGVNGGAAILAGVKNENSPLEPNTDYVSLSTRFLNPTRVEAEERNIKYTVKSKGTGRRRSRRNSETQAATAPTPDNPFAEQS